MSTCNALTFEREKSRRENVRKINFANNAVCRQKKRKKGFFNRSRMPFNSFIFNFSFSHVGDGLTDSLRGLSSTEVVINVICSVLILFSSTFHKKPGLTN